jgi:hypothetical protein
MTNEDLIAKLRSHGFSEAYIETQINKWFDDDTKKKQVQCSSCKGKFTPYPRGRFINRYCSRTCAQRAYRKRQKEKRETALSIV